MYGKDVTAIVVAAGKGMRMGAEVSKQFLLLDGKEILAHTIERLERAEVVTQIVLVTGKENLLDVIEMAKEYEWQKVCTVAEGGKERQDSVWNGLVAMPEETEIVLIHDGVRPFVSTEILENAVETALDMGACVVGVPTKDTIKVCDTNGIVLHTPDRRALWQIQTPQAFRKELILEAYEKARAESFLGTDDASVAEFFGAKIKVIMGDYKNIKITTKEDLTVASCFLEVEQE